MIFMQQMQYNTPNCMYAFTICPGEVTPWTPFGPGTQNRVPFPPKILAARLKVA